MLSFTVGIPRDCPCWIVWMDMLLWHSFTNSGTCCSNYLRWEFFACWVNCQAVHRWAYTPFRSVNTMCSFFTAWILYWGLSQRHCPVWIDMLVWDPFTNYLDHGTCCSIEVRVLCMLCHKMIDEYTSDITTNVCKHINIRFAFQSTNTLHSNAVFLFLFLFFHCMYTDGLSRRWRDTAPFGKQYGLTWDPFTNFYCLD